MSLGRTPRAHASAVPTRSGRLINPGEASVPCKGGSCRLTEFGAFVFFLRRLRLARTYAGLIEIMVGSVTRSGLAVVLRNKPELLEDDALRAVDMMFDNAQQDGDDRRADQLAVLRKFLMDARLNGVETALAAIPQSGPLPFQDSASEVDTT